jgi:hypothetical protein
LKNRSIAALEIACAVELTGSQNNMGAVDRAFDAA